MNHRSPRIGARITGLLVRWKPAFTGMLMGFTYLITGVSAAVAVACWGLRQLEPMRFLNIPHQPIEVYSQLSPERLSTYSHGRLVERVELSAGAAGRFRLRIGRPADATAPLPVIVLLGGIRQGDRAIRYVENPGPVVLVGYDYPLEKQAWYEDPHIEDIADMRRGAFRVPAQVTAALKWVSRQPWCDSTRVTLAGYSFGAFFIPAAARLAREHGIRLRGVIIAYGGADFTGVIEANLRVRPGGLRRAVAWVLGSLLYPLEPAHHLPYMEGRMLIINGQLDDQIPPECARKLHRLAPPPPASTILWLREGHMHPQKESLTKRLIRLTREWLAGHGGI